MGFCVEWVAAVTVLIASIEDIAIPVSTTHCQIGGVVGAGLVRYNKNLQDKILGSVCPMMVERIH